LSYRQESATFDDEILALIERWSDTGEPIADAEFDDLALRLFDYQFRYNEPYARYCAARGSGASTPRTWHEITPVPTTAFKDAVIATFDVNRAALTFETSGTTRGRSGRHYFESGDLYDAALLAGFDRFMLPDAARLQYFNLVPDPRRRPQSSLGYMMARVARQRGIGVTGWYVDGDALVFDAFVRDLQVACAEGSPVCIATTAFALAYVLERLEERRLTFALPARSRMMETGGCKGRARSVDRTDLYRSAAGAFGMPLRAIVAEYGMTELTSQYYDDTLVRAHAGEIAARRKFGPPWLRTRVVGPDGATLPDGTVGALVHVDLANRASCIAIATEDLGARFSGPDGDELLLIGRERGAELRGCSLDAETLRAHAR